MSLDDQLRAVEIHALAHSSGPTTLRIWLGVFEAEPPLSISWALDHQDLDLHSVTEVRPLTATPPGPPTTHSQTAIYDLTLPDDPDEIRPLRTVTATAVWAERTTTSLELQVRPLPTRMTTALGSTFRVLLVSCFAQGNDKAGLAGSLAGRLTRSTSRPDLVLTVGDQVYLDNPVPGPLHLTERGFAAEFERKYEANWRSHDSVSDSYAQVLRAAPVAAIPDDHEYWNNYPCPGAAWPSTYRRASRARWQTAAHDMYRSFQLGAPTDEPNAYSYTIDVAPLSFFMLDSRTFREKAKTASGDVIVSMLGTDLSAYHSWVGRMMETQDAIPVLVTGPSLLQGPSEHPHRDLNFADVVEYPAIMEGLLKMAAHGCPPLLLTGDVHYPRVSNADAHGAATAAASAPWTTDLYEIISSPASNILPSILTDSVSPNRTKPLTEYFDTATGTGATLRCRKRFPPADQPKLVIGNHLALLEFSLRSTGVDLVVQYWPVSRTGNPDRHLDVVLQRRRNPPGSPVQSSTPRPAPTSHLERS